MANYPEIEEKMQKRVAGFEGELKTIRAGRANASVLDKISVEYYGTMTPVAQVGSISVPEPRMLLIQPWDASILKEIEKAILASDIGISPQINRLKICFSEVPEKEEVLDIVKKISDLQYDIDLLVISAYEDEKQVVLYSSS